MKLFLPITAFVILVLSISISGVNALSYPASKVGEDISWPNCLHPIATQSSFGIVGATGGLALTPNNCIGKEASFYKDNLSLYINGGFPGEPYDLKFQNAPKICQLSNAICMAYNYGYNSALYAFNYSLSEGVVSNNWWIDVETVNSWSIDPNVNVSDLQGEIAGILFAARAGLVGFYSYPSQWQTITNSWDNTNATWQPTDNNIASGALSTCRYKGFNGDKPTIVQYLNHSETLDLDYAC